MSTCPSERPRRSPVLSNIALARSTQVSASVSFPLEASTCALYKDNQGSEAKSAAEMRPNHSAAACQRPARRSRPAMPLITDIVSSFASAREKYPAASSSSPASLAITPACTNRLLRSGPNRFRRNLRKSS